MKPKHLPGQGSKSRDQPLTDQATVLQLQVSFAAADYKLPQIHLKHDSTFFSKSCPYTSPHQADGNVNDSDLLLGPLPRWAPLRHLVNVCSPTGRTNICPNDSNAPGRVPVHTIQSLLNTCHNSVRCVGLNDKYSLQAYAQKNRSNTFSNKGKHKPYSSMYRNSFKWLYIPRKILEQMRPKCKW